MDDELTAIIAAADKVALEDYADRRGISLDRRKTFANMLKDYQNELAADAAPAPAVEADPAPEPVARPAPAKAAKAGMDPIRLLEMTQAWAATFAADIIRVEPVIDGTTLTVTLATRHGAQTHTTLISDESEAEIKSALESLRKLFVG